MSCTHRRRDSPHRLEFLPPVSRGPLGRSLWFLLLIFRLIILVVSLALLFLLRSTLATAVPLLWSWLARSLSISILMLSLPWIGKPLCMACSSAWPSLYRRPLTPGFDRRKTPHRGCIATDQSFGSASFSATFAPTPARPSHTTQPSLPTLSAPIPAARRKRRRSPTTSQYT